MLTTLIFSNVGPADIDVVAGIGDYLVSGTAALANNTGDTFRDNPEVSFAMGQLNTIMCIKKRQFKKKRILHCNGQQYKFITRTLY